MFQSIRHLRPMKRLLLILIVLLVASITAAQDDATEEPAGDAGDIPPILELLALVPDQSQFTDQELIGFSDFRAQAATREGVTDYDSWEDFEAAREAEDESSHLLLNALGFSGYPSANYLMSSGSEMPAAVGFDFFDIDAALSFGRPPGQVQILQGNFDADQIDAALNENGYVTDDLNGLPYWCPEAGCDTGSEVNMDNVNPANPFGGDLGRSFPVVMLDNALAASPSDANVEAVAEAYQDETDSLADDARYQTAVAAMYSPFAEGEVDAQLRQAYFVPTVFLAASDPLAAAIFAPDALEQLREQLETENTASLPLYQLAAFTDFGTLEQQYAQVVLIYGLEADAQTAIEMIPKRIDSFDSIVMQRPIAELFEERGAQLLDPILYTDDETGLYAAVFTFEYPAASNEEDDFGLVQMSGMVYQLMVSFIFQRDVVWLTPMLELPDVE